MLWAHVSSRVASENVHKRFKFVLLPNIFRRITDVILSFVMTLLCHESDVRGKNGVHLKLTLGGADVIVYFLVYGLEGFDVTCSDTGSPFAHKLYQLRIVKSKLNVGNLVV